MERKISSCDIKAFTLLELLIVVILVAIIVSFALPKYNEAVDKSIEKDIIPNLLSIHTANEIYRSQANRYRLGPFTDVGAINTAFDLTITPSSNLVLYNCLAVSGSGFDCFSTYAGRVTFAIRIDERPKGTDNPCCFSGACPTLPCCDGLCL